MTRRKSAPRPVIPNRPPGYRPKIRTREVTCEWDSLAPDEGCPPLTVQVRENLTFEQIDGIPNALRVGDDGEVQIIANDEIRAAISKYVVAWNLEAEDLKTGELVPVPPPAEIGPDAFRAVDWRVGSWLAIVLKGIHRTTPGLDAKKAPSVFGPETPPAPASD